MEEFDIKSGDIMKIATDGSITADKFKYSNLSPTIGKEPKKSSLLIAL